MHYSFTRFLTLGVFLLLGVWRAVPCLAEQGPVILLKDDKTTYTIGNYVNLLEDPTGKISFKEVRQLNTFTRSRQEAPVFGPSSSAVWCLFRVRNTGTQNTWYLEVGSAYLHEADLYQENESGAYTLIKAGAGQPFDSRLVKTNRIILPLDLPAGSERTFYARFRSRSILRFPLKIATMQALYETNHTFDLVNGIYFGLLFALMMYNLFVYISLRDKAYLYYILFIFSIAADMACIRGYLLEWLPESLLWFVRVRFFSGLAILFSLLFTNAILQVKQNLPRLYRLRWVVVASLCLVLVLNLLRFYVWSFTWMLISFIPIYFYVYTAGILIYRKGFKPALFYTIASAALGIGIFIYISKDNNLLPETTFTESSLQLGSFIEAVVLSYALANKFDLFKREKEQAQALAVQQATTFSQELIQSQEHERKRIAAELHDSVGQSLILIKNKLLILKKRFDDPLKVAQQAEDLTETVAHTISEIRSISYGLRPFQLDMLGLTQSIKSLADEVSEVSGIDIRIEADSIDGLFPKDQEINVYRIVQESLNNMVKHSCATKACIRISLSNRLVELTIEDNGKGIQLDAIKVVGKQGFGLRGLQERVSILSGNLEIKPAAPQGTCIQVTLPVIMEPVSAQPA